MADTHEQERGDLRLGPGLLVPREVLRFTAVRSSGPGGQNVNKVATKVELRVSLDDLPLDDGARGRLERLASHLVTSQGEIVITADETRSQARNKDACMEKLRELLLRALTAPKPRRKTKPTRASERRRLDEKRQRGETKRRRQRPEEDH